MPLNYIREHTNLLRLSQPQTPQANREGGIAWGPKVGLGWKYLYKI